MMGKAAKPKNQRGYPRAKGQSAKVQHNKRSEGEFWKVFLKKVIGENIIVYPKLTLLFSAFLFSCSGPSDRTSAETAYALLKNPGSFFWYSNDQAVGDSALQHLPGGVISPLQKQGNYHFKIAGNYTSPEIQIYPLSVSGNSMRVSSQGETVVLKKTGEGVWEGDWIGSDQAEIRRCVLLSDGSRRAAVPQGAWITGSGNHEASVALPRKK